MGKFLNFSSPFNSIKPRPQISDQIELNLSSDSSSNSNLSLTSQPSLPSVPSLQQPAAAADHHHCSATLKPHSSYIFSLTLAGEHLYCGDAAGTITLCDPTPNLPGNYSSTPVAISSTAVKSIVISGDKIFAAHQDHKIRVWKIDSANQQKYRKITILPTLSDRCARLFSPRNYVRVRRHKKRTWVHHNDAVSALALTSDGSSLYSVSWDRTFKVWRTSDFKCLESVENAHDDAINAVVLSSDGFVYTGSADRTIKVWRKNDVVVGKHTLISTLEKHKSAVNALALSADGSVLYSGACDRSIIVWEKDGGEHMAVLGALRGHTKAILCLAVVNELLFSGSADKTVRVWRRGGSGNSYSCLAVFQGHRNPVKCLTACLDNDDNDDNNNNNNNNNKSKSVTAECGDSYVVYSGSLDCEIKVWKILL